MNLVYDEDKLNLAVEEEYPQPDTDNSEHFETDDDEAQTIIERIFRYFEERVSSFKPSLKLNNQIGTSASKNTQLSLSDMQTLASFMILSSLVIGYGDAWLNNLDYTLGAFSIPILYLALFLFIFKRESLSRESLTLISYLFSWGVFSGIMSATLNVLIISYIAHFPVAFVEEPMKIIGLFMLAKAGILKFETDNKFDWLLYGAAAGAGFASIENIQYIISMTAGGDFTLYSAMIIRSTVSFSHIAWSAIVGRFLGLAMGLRDKVLFRDLLLGLMIAIPLHTFWNSFYTLRATFVLPITLLLIYEEVESIYTPKM